MFRVVTGETGPTFFLLCDHRQCMEARTGAADMSDVTVFEGSKREFCTAAGQEGWLITLENMLCPAHAGELLAAAKRMQERQRLVQPANGIPILNFARRHP